MRLVTFLLALMFTAHATFAQDILKANGKEWRVVLTGIDQMLLACPEGVCSGSVGGPGGQDLDGYTWASLDEMNALINSYIGSPVLKPGLNDYSIDDSEWATRFIDDFGVSGLDLGFYWATGVTRESDRETFGSFYVGDSRLFGSRDTARSSISSSASGSNYTARFWLWRESDDSEPASSFTINLEEPIHAESHSGIGLIRGWAVAKELVSKAEIFIDGEYAYDVPLGGHREDVAAAFPQMLAPLKSGFAMAFGYSNLAQGIHTVAVRVHTASGSVKEAASQFEVTKFHKPYITSQDVVDLTYSHAQLDGKKIILREVEIDGQFYTVQLLWRPYRQGFEIVEIK